MQPRRDRLLACAAPTERPFRQPVVLIPAATPCTVSRSKSRIGSFSGGGSLPDQKMPTWVVEVAPSGLSDELLAYRLRTGEPSVMGRLRDGKLVLDVRTVFPHQEAALVDAVARAAGQAPPEVSA